MRLPHCMIYKKNVHTEHNTRQKKRKKRVIFNNVTCVNVMFMAGT